MNIATATTASTTTAPSSSSSQDSQLLTWSNLQNTNETPYNSSYMAYVGWQNTSNDDPTITYLFSEANLMALQAQIAHALQGVEPQGREIRVTLPRIAEVLSNMYQNATRTRVGDIYSRYIVPQDQNRCDVREINNLTINVIVRAVKDEYETIANNQRLTVWSTLLGDFNKEGLRSHPPIKIRRRHPQYMAFNMNY